MTFFWFDRMKFSKNHLVRALKSFRSRFLLCHDLFLYFINYFCHRSYLKRCQLKLAESFVIKFNKQGTSMEGSIILELQNRVTHYDVTNRVTNSKYFFLIFRVSNSV